MSQVKEFALLCMVRCKSLGSLNSFLWYVPQPSGVNILCFPILSFFRVYHQRWLQSWRKLDGGQSLFLFQVPSGLTVIGWQSMATFTDWPWHPLYTDMAGIMLSSRLLLIRTPVIAAQLTQDDLPIWRSLTAKKCFAT